MEPCPFCGGKPHMRKDNDSEVNAYCQHVYITCSGCGATIHRAGDTSKGGYADNSHVEADTLAAWNRRV